MRADTHQRARRRVALACLSLWLVGFEVVPGLHRALHDRLGAHDHGGGAQVLADGARSAKPKRSRIKLTSSRRAGATASVAGRHRHGAGPAHRHDADPGAPERTPGHHDRAPTSPDHGAGSLEHRGVAAIEPAPVDLPPAAIVLAAIALVAPRPLPARSRAPRDRFVRGPPVLA